MGMRPSAPAAFYLPGGRRLNSWDRRRQAPARQPRSRRREERDGGADKGVPSLADWEFASNECEIEAPEDVLEFLEQAQLQGPVAFEWPEGEALKVSRTIGAEKLSIKLIAEARLVRGVGQNRGRRGSCCRHGGGPSQLDRAHGRFVPLDNGRFIALTRGFAAPTAPAGGRIRRSGRGPPSAWPRQHGRGRSRGKRRQGAGRQTLARVVGAHPGGGIDTPKVPATLQAELRDYQAEGFSWMSRLANLQMGACLADDMGLGKTIQTIAVMLEQQAHGPCLVVAPHRSATTGTSSWRASPRR